jgi:DNA-binding beta-propeller fold protein YncE
MPRRLGKVLATGPREDSITGRHRSLLRHRRLGAALAAALVSLLLAGAAHAANGTWERTWGKDVVSGNAETGFEVCTAAASCKGGLTGGLGGEMNVPFGVATDAAGNVYVADQANNRIQKFDSSGVFLRAWGEDVVSGNAETGFEVCTAAASCKAGAQGGLGGEMTFPLGVASDAAGNVYVADSFNHRIQKFDSSGVFLRAWGKDVDQTGGTGFEVCTAAASCKAGAPGGLGGEMNFPTAVATDAAGNLYLADQNNNRIQKFDSSGAFLRTWGEDVDQTGGTGFEVCIAAGSCKPGDFGELGGEMSSPASVATDAAGDVYVADLDNNRIQKFDSSGVFLRAWGKDVDQTGGTGFEVCTVAASCKAGATGGLGGDMNLPTGVASDAAGDVYVVDTSNHRIQKFSDPLPPPPAEPTPQPGPAPEVQPKADGTLTIDANKGKVEKGRKVTLSGQYDVAANESCEPNRPIQIQRRLKSEDDSKFATFTTVSTDAAGDYTLKAKVKKTYFYRAVVSESEACDDETSNSQKVRVQKKKAAQEA